MEFIEHLINSPHKGETFIIVIAAILSVQFLVKVYDFFVERFGLETKGMKREKKQIESITKLEQEVDDIKKEVKDIQEYSEHAAEKRIKFEEDTTSALQQIKDDMVKSRVDTLRSRILEFGSSCKIKDYTKENFDYILKSADEYHNLLEQYNMTNSQTDMAMEYIRKKYAEYLESGFPNYQQ